MDTKVRVIAMYLPQYHPIPENDEAWGKGFTEWTNVAQARPLFRGHYQPKIPADLGFYDLRLPEVRQAQADMARNAGIEGFMYWHYWFGDGRMLLEKPFQEVLKTGAPDYPFCLGWANHSWMTKTWKKGKSFQKDPMIMEMRYPGKEDHLLHFNYCLPAFRDKRYIKIDDKPVFVIWAPGDMPDVSDFIHNWRILAKEAGLPGIHFVGLRYGRYSYDDIRKMGFDAINDRSMSDAIKVLNHSKYLNALRYKLRNYFSIPIRMDYRKVMKKCAFLFKNSDDVYPTIVSGYDRTARSGGDTVILTNYNPETFKEHIQDTIKLLDGREYDHKVVFLQSWNEWGEGNYVEPDLKYGHQFLDAIKSSITK